MESGEDHGGGCSIYLRPMERIMPKRILSLFRNLFRKRSMEEALDDELRWTLDALIETVFETILESRSARAIAKFEEWEAAEEIREESIFLTFRRSRWQAA